MIYIRVRSLRDILSNFIFLLSIARSLCNSAQATRSMSANVECKACKTTVKEISAGRILRDKEEIYFKRARQAGFTRYTFVSIYREYFRSARIEGKNRTLSLRLWWPITFYWNHLKPHTYSGDFVINCTSLHRTYREKLSLCVARFFRSAQVTRFHSSI